MTTSPLVPRRKISGLHQHRSTPDPDRNYNSDIWVVAATTPTRRAPYQVTTNPGPDPRSLLVSDGKWIAFVSQTDIKDMIYAPTTSPSLPHWR